ncbi:MAG TPA: hypothetical protein VFC19_49715 [Candidatus Limnocylindrales bacterium]|nr:hypothetical protein [Candidatus Limnocylindrales bacterium]
MMPELDQPFGQRRWDPPAEIETLTATKATPSVGDDVPDIPVQADLAD